MEFMEGCRVDDVDAVNCMNVDPVHIADSGFHAYIRQIFRDGFFDATLTRETLPVSPKVSSYS